MVGQTEKKLKLRERKAVMDSAVPLILGFVAYCIAAVSTFSIPQLTHVHLDQVAIALLTSAAGLLVIGLGYGSIVLLGGVCSLRIAGLFSRLTKTRQLLEPKEEKSVKLRKTLVEKSHLVYLPAVLFFTSIAIGWDIYSTIPARTTATATTATAIPITTRHTILGAVLRSLNFFATPQRANAVLFSLRLTPGLIAITLISGLVPSIALPYFRRFKIVGINSGPFHSTILFTVLGSVVGFSIVISLLQIFYKVLYAGAPTSYHFALIVLIGFSLHYSAGTYIGRSKSESIILRKIANGRYDHNRIVILDRRLNPNAEAIDLRSFLRPQLDGG
jgi:hypothetical protein